MCLDKVRKKQFITSIPHKIMKIMYCNTVKQNLISYVTWNSMAFVFSGLQLNGVDFVNNSNLVLTDIGESTSSSALFCVTDNAECCRGSDNPNGGGLGEWYFPDGTLVPTGNTNSIYRNRDRSAVRLNRMSTVEAPTGVYRCEVPDASGTNQSVSVGLYLGKYTVVTEGNKFYALFFISFSSDTHQFTVVLPECHIHHPLLEPTIRKC